MHLLSSSVSQSFARRTQAILKVIKIVFDKLATTNTSNLPACLRSLTQVLQLLELPNMDDSHLIDTEDVDAILALLRYQTNARFEELVQRIEEGIRRQREERTSGVRVCIGQRFRMLYTNDKSRSSSTPMAHTQVEQDQAPKIIR